MGVSSGTRVVIVGGGVGGLSAGAYLADAGASVHLIEQNDQFGGRASTLERDGFTFDMGPSWYILPDLFERFFGHFGHEPTDFYALESLDPLYRLFYGDGDRMDVQADRQRRVERYESSEDGAGEALESYLETSASLYDVGVDTLLTRNRDGIRDYVDPDLLRAAPQLLRRLGPLDDHVADYVDHPKLRQHLLYLPVFLGGSPSITPALYSMMNHGVDDQGVYYPEDGFRSVVDALVAVARDRGLTAETGTAVTALGGTPGSFEVHLADGRCERADAVVVNADYAYAERELLPASWRQYDDDYWDSRTYAPSAYILYLGIDGGLGPLAHHSILLPTDWDPYFASIFEDPHWPAEPAIYVCAASRTDDDLAPAGHNTVFVLVPIATGLDDGPDRRAAYRERVLDRIATHTGVNLRDRIVVEEDFAVSDFAGRYNATRGTAFGLAHTLGQTEPFRPSNRSSAVDDLYFTGAYTTPGIGVPLCLVSGERTARALLADRGVESHTESHGE